MKMKDQMMALGNLISGVSLPTSIHVPSFYLEMKKSEHISPIYDEYQTKSAKDFAKP